MGFILYIRHRFYDRLRSGGIFSCIPFYIAAFVYWFTKTRRPYVGTRIVEIPWVLKQLEVLSNDRQAVLQFGDILRKKALKDCSLELVDHDAEEVSHPGVTVHKGDIRNVTLPENHFDGSG